MAGILLIYILGIYFLLTKMVQLEDEAVVGVKKTHKELSETAHSSNEKAIQYVASNMIKEALRLQSHLTTDQARHGHRNYWMD